MKILELKAEKRTTRGSKAVKKLRGSGQIPAILYGHKPDNVMLCLNEHDFTRILHSGTRMINLTVDNKKESALIKDVEIECLPTAIPEKIKVNISELGIGKAIHVKELPVLEGIQYISETELVVASVHQIVEAKAVSEEELLAEPEVITKKPKEGEEESAEAAKKT